MKNNNDNILTKRYFYYLRDEHGLPRVTICLTHFLEEDVICRGLAICSILDNPTKKLGNMISAGRALKAYRLRQNCRPVGKENSKAHFNVEMLEDSSLLTLPNWNRMYEGQLYKCYFNPELTDYEMALISPND